MRSGYARARVALVAVPLFDSETSLAPLRPEIIDKLAEVVTAGRFVLGPEVAAFEAEFAAYLGVGHVVGVANGTDALSIALSPKSFRLRASVEVRYASNTLGRQRACAARACAASF